MNIEGATERRFANFCATEKGQELIDSVLKDLELSLMRQKEIVETCDYIEWLERFVKVNPVFSDDTWLYKQDEISAEDYDNVNQLSTFFDAIQKFADENYIPATRLDFGKYYSLRYNNKIYEIGIIVGQGSLTICNTVDINKDATVIEFEELAKPSEKTRTRTESIDAQLSKIDNLLKSLRNDLDIPVEAIVDRVDKVLTELEKK